MHDYNFLNALGGAILTKMATWTTGNSSYMSTIFECIGGYLNENGNLKRKQILHDFRMLSEGDLN